MSKKTKYDNDPKCEIPSGVLKSIISRYWWESWNSIPVKRLDVKMAEKAVKDVTGETFDWNIGRWKPGIVKPERRIFVISVDTQDFINCKRDSKFREIPLDVPRRFKVGKDTYQCITHVCDLKSYTADKVIETEHAVENPDYYHIIESSKLCLKYNNL